VEIIRTARLELVPLDASFVDALKRGDRRAAEREIGARVSRWLVIDPAHFVQLRLAQLAADAIGMAGIGRAIVLVPATGRRRVIGSIGFHGPPDDRGRLELGCVIDPVDQRQGYAAEAMTALVEWAAHRHGITRFVVAIPLVGERGGGPPVEIGFLSAASSEVQLEALAPVLESERPPRA
jgi:RimJ/RimL family protein N-acetyltransferase